MQALADLSKAIFQDPYLRSDPNSVALAFWLRASHLEQLSAAALEHQPKQSVLVPAGLVFHIAPANVDTLFVYSWALSFLCGNQNIVRLSTSPSRLVTELLRVIAKQARSKPELWLGNAFVTYPHDDAITGLFSAHCDQRIIWGGNETVAKIRTIPLNPHASERAFASKFSVALIDAQSLDCASDDVLQHLSDNLAKDISPFDQRACSSPHLIYWLCEDPSLGRVLSERLSDAVSKSLASTKAPDLGDAVRRIEQGFLLAADGLITKLRCQPHLTSTELSEPMPALERLEVGTGFLSHRFLNSLEAIAAEMTPEHQTLSHFGLSDEQLQHLAKLGGARGLDRLVPIGKALDFDVLWDGADIFGDFLRYVRVVGQSPSHSPLSSERSPT
jgi:hypothetical protein